MTNGRVQGGRRVAVVLSTYNGSLYVCEQLDSLLSQTRLPDLIVIRDDCSTDDTAEIIRLYIGSHADVPVAFDFATNECNVGWKANFRRMMAACDSDYVFPCDQDDIWAPKKIEHMVKVMDDSPDLDLLACAVQPFYEAGAQKTDAAVVSASAEIGSVKREGIAPDFMYITHPGCSYCVRGSFVQRILPYWRESYPHDGVLWRFAVLEGGAGVLNEQLVRFRRHAGNASARKKQTLEARLADLDHYLEFFDQAGRFVAACDRCSGSASALLCECVDWLKVRKDLLTTGSLSAAFACLRRRRFYKTNRGLALDIFLAYVKGARA